MFERSSIRVTTGLFVGMMAISFGGCGKVNNEDNYAVITGRVLNSESDPTGVGAVEIWVESDPTSESAYLGGDVSIRTDVNGEYRGDIFLGYMVIRDRPEEGSGGIFSMDFPQYVGDARIFMVYGDKWLDLGGGFTLQASRTLRIWDVYLTEFVPMSGDSAVGGSVTLPSGG
jgi:hypothetical protein